MKTNVLKSTNLPVDMYINLEDTQKLTFSFQSILRKFLQGHVIFWYFIGYCGVLKDLNKSRSYILCLIVNFNHLCSLNFSHIHTISLYRLLFPTQKEREPKKWRKLLRVKLFLLLQRNLVHEHTKK